MTSSPHSNRSSPVPATILAATATRLGNWAARQRREPARRLAGQVGLAGGRAHFLLVGERAHVERAEIPGERGHLVGQPGRTQRPDHGLGPGQQARAERHAAQGQPGHARVAPEHAEHVPGEGPQGVLPVTAAARHRDLGDDLLEDELDQLFLVGHVAVQRRGRDPDLPGHPAHGQRVPAVRLDDLEGGRHDGLPAELRPRRAPAARRRPPRRRRDPRGRRSRLARRGRLAVPSVRHGHQRT